MPQDFSGFKHARSKGSVNTVVHLWLAHDSIKINQRQVTPKGSKGRQSFLYETYRVSLTYMAIKFHHDSPKGYLFMGCTNIV